MIDRAAIALDRIRDGRSARSIILYGLRGVGKTVLLNKIKLDAQARGIVPESKLPRIDRCQAYSSLPFGLL